MHARMDADVGGDFREATWCAKWSVSEDIDNGRPAVTIHAYEFWAISAIQVSGATRLLLAKWRVPADARFPLPRVPTAAGRPSERGLGGASRSVQRLEAEPLRLLDQTGQVVAEVQLYVLHVLEPALDEVLVQRVGAGCLEHEQQLVARAEMQDLAGAHLVLGGQRGCLGH